MQTNRILELIQASTPNYPGSGLPGGRRNAYGICRRTSALESRGIDEGRRKLFHRFRFAERQRGTMTDTNGGGADHV